MYSTTKQCVIADRSHGVMILLKRMSLINMVDKVRNDNVKLTVRFFDFKNGVIHATEKTEIEIDDEVYIYLNYINIPQMNFTHK